MPDINPSFRPHQRAVVSFVSIIRLLRNHPLTYATVQTRSKATTSPLKTANTRGPTNVLTNYFSEQNVASRA